jgi:hypothetical protein
VSPSREDPPASPPEAEEPAGPATHEPQAEPTTTAPTEEPAGPATHEPQAEPTEGAADAPRSRWLPAARRATGIGAPAALIAATLVVLAGAFLHVYSHEHMRVPLGFDTPKYVWRANLVGGEGVEALPGSAPPAYKVDPGRVGHPILASLVHAVAGITPFRLSFVMPAVMAIVIGLAAGALAVGPLREPPWAFPVYAIAAGASVNVFLTAVGYADNLIVDGIAVAIAATALAVSGGRASVGAVAALFAGGVLIHSIFVLLLALILACVVAASIPESVVAWRGKRVRLARTPAVRLAVAMALAGVAVVAMVLISVRSPQGSPSVPRAVSLTKLALFAPKYHFAVVGTAAAVGIVALWWPRDATRRRGMLLALIWALTAAAAVVALVKLDKAVPAHRVVGFALGIPILAAAAVTGVARLMTSRGPPVVRAVGGLAGAALVLAGVWYTVATGYHAWSENPKSIDPGAYEQALTAGRYLQDAHIDRPVIFVTNPQTRDPRLALYENFGLVRAAVPPEAIARTFVYLGDPALLRNGQPTRRPNDKAYNKSSRKYFRYLKPYLDADPVVFVLEAQNKNTRFQGSLPGSWALTPDVTVVEGPRVESARPRPVRLEPLSQGTLVGWTAAALALVWVAGIGWSAGLVDGGWWERVALAPAIGIAALVVVGLAANRLGAGLLGTSGVAIAAATALLGWGAFGVRAWRPWRRLVGRRDRQRPAGEEPAGDEG